MTPGPGLEPGTANRDSLGRGELSDQCAIPALRIFFKALYEVGKHHDSRNVLSFANIRHDNRTLLIAVSFEDLCLCSGA